MNVVLGFTGLFSESADGGPIILTSSLTGIAAALAVALTLTVFLRSGRRTWRDFLRHGLAAGVALSLFVFVTSDLHHTALAYLGLNPSKPAVEFEIRLPRAALAIASETQVELHTDRNERLARIANVDDLTDGRALLKGTVALDYRTAERMLVVTLSGGDSFEFKLRLPANPGRSEQFGPWHLADRVASPAAGRIAPQDAFAIRYRVL